MKKIIVTGGAGFIGSALIRLLINETEYDVINVDKLTYAANLEALNQASSSARYFFEQIDICDKAKMEEVFSTYKPTTVIHLAAESHVDRSIEGPGVFIDTNIKGTYNLLEVARNYCNSLNQDNKSAFRFIHVSTDEVFGDLGREDSPFDEETSYNPSSPYSASKAASDHLVSAWFRTFNFPAIITNCSNNYGYYQHSEKLIPLVIKNALSGCDIPIYGNGLQVRDWLFVNDHVKALLEVLTKGQVGETYNIGGHNEKENISVVLTICAILDELVPHEHSYSDLITYVDDRLGHDERYAIDARKIENELGWKPDETFNSGIRKTVQWYVENMPWLHK